MRSAGAHIVARPSSIPIVRDLLSRNETLYRAAAIMPGSRSVPGRGAAYAIDTADGGWLVRHYRRGGAIARVLGDRYTRFGAGRALRELQVSVAASGRGIATPEVVAAVTYPSGLFNRYDIAVVLIPNAVDLAAVLFGDDAPLDADIAKAAAVIRGVCAGGLRHADLNLKNILIAPDRGYVVDLDRCRIGRPSAAHAAAMQRRFSRSLEKWQARTGRIVPAATRRLLEAAFRVA